MYLYEYVPSEKRTISMLYGYHGLFTAWWQCSRSFFWFLIIYCLSQSLVFCIFSRFQSMAPQASSIVLYPKTIRIAESRQNRTTFCRYNQERDSVSIQQIEKRASAEWSLPSIFSFANKILMYHLRQLGRLAGFENTLVQKWFRERSFECCRSSVVPQIRSRIMLKPSGQSSIQHKRS